MIVLHTADRSIEDASESEDEASEGEGDGDDDTDIADGSSAMSIWGFRPLITLSHLACTACLICLLGFFLNDVFELVV